LPDLGHRHTLGTILDGNSHKTFFQRIERERAQ
jgi:hypothetical protein